MTSRCYAAADAPCSAFPHGAESRLRSPKSNARACHQLLVQPKNAYWDAATPASRCACQDNSLELRALFVCRAAPGFRRFSVVLPAGAAGCHGPGAVTQAFRLPQAQDVLPALIGADLDPDFGVPIVSPRDAPPSEAPTLVRGACQPAGGCGPSAAGLHDLEIRRSNISGPPTIRARSLDQAGYARGTGGNFFPTAKYGENGQVIVIPGGFPQALDQLFQFRFPTYGFGLTLQLPLRNRRAAADLANATIQKRRDLYALRSEEQGVRLDVLNAVAGVELAKAALSQPSGP